jgi:hypothetical protein
MWILLTVCLLFVFSACIAFLYSEGMWSNAVRLINVIMAALLAMNYFEPVARWMSGWTVLGIMDVKTMQSLTAIWDYLALWGLFSISLVAFHQLTSRISHVQVRFLQIVDRIGSAVFAVLIGWVMVCFTLATFHAAPMARNFMYEGFNPDNSMFLGILAPDREWLGFTSYLSGGTYSGSDHFESDAYISKQATKRTNLEKYAQQYGGIRVNPDAAKAGAMPVGK